MRRRTCLSAIILVLCLPTALSGFQQSDHPTETHFASQARLVIVPAIVQRGDKPVENLTKEDFAVFQDGKQQEIANFEIVRTEPVKRGAAAAAAATAGEYSNIGPNVPTRYTIIVLDFVRTTFRNQIYARKGLLRYLRDNIDGTEPIALLVVTRSGMHVIHQFSSDPAALLLAVKTLSPLVESQLNEGASFDMSDDQLSIIAQRNNMNEVEFAAGTRLLYNAVFEPQVFRDMMVEQATFGSLEAVSGLARAYTGVPGRKSVLWISEWAPFPPVSSNGSISYQTAKCLRELANANMSIYPVDMEGLDPNAKFRTSITPMQHTSVNNPLARQADISNRAEALAQLPDTLTTRVDGLRWVASATGGKAIVQNNDTAKSIQRAMEDSFYYYQLAYYLKPDAKPGWHKLEVKVRQPKVTVRARTGVVVDKLGSEGQQQSDVAKAIGSPLDMSGIPMIFRWLGQGGNAGEAKRVDFQLSILPSGLTVDDKANNHVSLTITVLPRRSDGTLLAGTVRNLDANLTADRLGQFARSGLNYSSAMELPSGRYKVKFLVRDNVSGEVGTITADLNVT